MFDQKESPEAVAADRSKDDILNMDFDGKVTQKLSNRQKKVFNLLMAGKFSAADITIRLGYCDPRSYIREFRNRGINVLDEWISKNGTHFKKYWIETPQPQNNIKKIYTDE